MTPPTKLKTVKLVKGSHFVGQVEVPDKTLVITVLPASAELAGTYVRGIGTRDWFYWRITTFVDAKSVEVLK